MEKKNHSKQKIIKSEWELIKNKQKVKNLSFVENSFVKNGRDIAKIIVFIVNYKQIYGSERRIKKSWENDCSHWWIHKMEKASGAVIRFCVDVMKVLQYLRNE